MISRAGRGAARRGMRWRGRCAAGCTPPADAPARPEGSRTGLQRKTGITGLV